MRPTTIIGLLGLGVVGIIAADFLIHPAGTAAAGNAVNTVVKTAVQGLLGTAPK
jgi:predicted ATP-grasp superfamily ATP-dependent carboligase